ncbi:LuxR C-terminal-related transcriptional regulator [Streptomyces tricolor]|nr:LuxR C-terminal-related transcriptional regulator [Streptomyces tricolor]
MATLLTADPRLSARTRDLLQAVAARQLPPRMSELTHLPDGRAVSVLGAVREAVEAGVLVLDGDRLRFRHPRCCTRPRPCCGTSRRRGDAEGGALSPTEEAITRLVAAGLTNRQIASRVNLSPTRSISTSGRSSRSSVSARASNWWGPVSTCSARNSTPT